MNLEIVVDSKSCRNISIFYLIKWSFFCGNYSRVKARGENYMRKYRQILDYVRASGGIPHQLKHLTQFSHYTDFSRNQNVRKSGNRCTAQYSVSEGIHVSHLCTTQFHKHKFGKQYFFPEPKVALHKEALFHRTTMVHTSYYEPRSKWVGHIKQAGWNFLFIARWVDFFFKMFKQASLFIRELRVLIKKY